jgi:O-antigen ligase
VNSQKINIDRYRTLGSIENDYNFQAGGRTDIWKRGITLFTMHPLTGVGVDAFPKALGDMRAAEQNTLPRWQAAHNAYILVLTETGIAGSAPFLGLIIVCLLTFNRIRRSSASIEDKDLAALPGLLFVGFAAQLVAAVFLSQAYSMYFTLAFAMSGALRRLTSTAPTLSRAARPGVVSLPRFSVRSNHI